MEVHINILVVVLADDEIETSRNHCRLVADQRLFFNIAQCGAELVLESVKVETSSQVAQSDLAIAAFFNFPEIVEVCSRVNLIESVNNIFQGRTVSGSVNKSVFATGVSTGVGSSDTAESVNLANFRQNKGTVESGDGSFELSHKFFNLAQSDGFTLFVKVGEIGFYIGNNFIGCSFCFSGEHTDFFTKQRVIGIKFRFCVAQSRLHNFAVGEFLKEVIVGLLQVVDDFAGCGAFIVSSAGNLQVLS
ncbi:hypothetical protein IMSAGC014_01438 [Bacteroidaceae bacterium]|nr:hypothetical protein IMSAGC014_01438 [Bacteroidaceae bacterium]